MRYRINGWFRGARVQLCWDEGELRGPAVVLAAVVDHPARGSSVIHAPGLVRIDDRAEAMQLIRRVLDDIDGVRVSEDESVLEFRPHPRIVR